MGGRNSEVEIGGSFVKLSEVEKEGRNSEVEIEGWLMTYW